MADFDGWKKIEPRLGEGGQGVVYKARSPIRAAKILNYSTEISHGLRALNSVGPTPSIEDLVKLIVDVGSPDDVKDLGALKIFDVPPDGSERDKALGRLDAEIIALKNISHPGVLKLLHSNIAKNFIVTEYHALGTLDSHLNKYAGRALEALVAFRPLVEAVSFIHKSGAIHRDIKPQNIFIANDGRLVLGDFGIVLFKDANRERMTETYERVGTRNWMAPWANTEHRLALEEVKPTLDIFPLGKVLWSMVSGRKNLEYWYYARLANGSLPANFLPALFPNDPGMHVINEILAKCIVEHEKDCLKSAVELLDLVDGAIASLRPAGLRPPDGAPWRCRICGKGHYRDTELRAKIRANQLPHGLHLETEFPVAVYVCDNLNCRHVEFIFAVAP